MFVVLMESVRVIVMCCRIVLHKKCLRVEVGKGAWR